MRSVRARLLPGGVLALAVLAALQVAVGLGVAGWVVGSGFDLATLVLLDRGLARAGTAGPGPADQVTLARAALVGGVAALVADSFGGAISVGLLVGLATVALLLDGVDGRLARRTGTESAVGARFDMEVDAFLILALAVYAAGRVGAWVVLIGLARYLLLVAGAVWPWLRRPSPPRYWAKVVAAIQGVVLAAVASGLLGRAVSTFLALVALGLLAESFGRQVVWLAGSRSSSSDDVAVEAHRRRPRVLVGRRRIAVARALAMAAVAVVWAALALPDQLARLGPWTFLQVPAEGVLLMTVALVLPGRSRQLLAAAAGSVLGLLVLLKLLDMGYYAELGRALNPVVDWSSLGPGIGVLRDSVGPVAAYAAVLAAVLAALTVVALTVWASMRVARLGGTHRRRSAWVLGALGIVWVGSALGGLNVTAQLPIASRATSSFAVAQVRDVAAAARDRVAFPRAAAAPDPAATTEAADLLTGLRGKDVIVAFVESYGQTAVQGSSFAPGIVPVLDRGTKALTDAGFASRSAFLTSPTFGGLSWLAHSTLQSGLWIDNLQRYAELTASHRFTLSDAFKKAGWRTVVDDPANVGPWAEGTSFYHYDQQYNARNTGYAGPRFSYATMPDQFTLKAFADRELQPGHAPVMAEIDLVSSHYPWTPLPRMVPWAAIGDGSVYDPMPAQGPSVASLYTNYDNVRAAYGQSIQYSIESLISFVQNAHDPNLVLVLLGDHQPSPKVSGPNATHDVPISIVAHDRAVLDRVASWNWQPGLRPAADAPTWPMDAFRNRFLDAFAGRLTTEAAAVRSPHR